MTDPYAVLGLSPDADEATVRKRYLELVRQYPPERERERFAEIRRAYDQLRDPVANLENRLFSVNATHTFDSLLAEVQGNFRQQRLATETLLSLAQS